MEINNQHDTGETGGNSEDDTGEMGENNEDDTSEVVINNEDDTEDEDKLNINNTEVMLGLLEAIFLLWTTIRGQLLQVCWFFEAGFTHIFLSLIQSNLCSRPAQDHLCLAIPCL